MPSADGGGVVVFCRMGSTRLPGKVLMDVAGRPLLGRLLDQLKVLSSERKTVIATTSEALDDPIIDFAEKEQIDCFRGHPTDTLDRGIACAEYFGFKYFARVCGDSPFMNPRLIRALFEIFEKSDVDIVTNIFPRTFPAGISGEIISVDTLRSVEALTGDPQDREHMTRFIYDNPFRFQIRNVESHNDTYQGVHLAVDTERDLERARWIASNMDPNSGEFDLDATVTLARQFDGKS